MNTFLVQECIVECRKNVYTVFINEPTIICWCPLWSNVPFRTDSCSILS